MKIRIVIKRPFGNIEFEGNNLDEIVEELQSFPEWLDIIDRLVLSATPQEVQNTEDFLSKIMVLSKEGPLVPLSREKISDKEAIGLILYAGEPRSFEPKEVGRLLELSGRPSSGFGARLSEMKREGLVIKENGAYRLSVIGRRWVKELIERLRKNI
ncbi:TPA: hypothetical protein EYP70_06975 [Candidatus Bathyarchaeota archaeon]|nr:hypothetical protein [Candidatus Bathyarchaeota archaeon]